MKKAVLILSGIALLMTSCTSEDTEIKKENSIKKNNEIYQGAPEVDPGTVKPPTHG
jgi:hypothetical protein